MILKIEAPKSLYGYFGAFAYFAFLYFNSSSSPFLKSKKDAITDANSTKEITKSKPLPLPRDMIAKVR